MARRTTPARSMLIVIPDLTREFVTVAIVATTWFFSDRMAAKAKRTLMPGGTRKTAAERVDIKLHPREEYRDSMSIDREFHEHSNVYYPATAIKQAITTAALSVPIIMHRRTFGRTRSTSPSRACRYSEFRAFTWAACDRQT